MKILIIGGMHGNEPLGLKLVDLFRVKPIKGIEAIVGNEKAVLENCRFIKQDLNRSFPGYLASKEYEQLRAAELLNISKNYDLVLDIHNTCCPNNDCCFVGETANDDLYCAAGFLALPRVIVADYECINKYANNCLSVEISLSSPLNNAKLWYKYILSLSKIDNLGDEYNIEKYRFIYRITIEDRDKYKLIDQNLEAFKQLDVKLANQLGVESPAYPIFINDKYTPYAFGGILNKLPN